MLKTLIRYLNVIARGLEIAISIIVLLAVIWEIIQLRDLFAQLVLETESMALFHVFLEDVLTIVIGLEFFRMLCFSDVFTVLEVLMFVLARHMIVNDTSAMENLLTVMGIVVVVLLNLYLRRSKVKKTAEEDGDLLGTLEEADEDLPA